MLGVLFVDMVSYLVQTLYVEVSRTGDTYAVGNDLSRDTMRGGSRSEK